MTTYQSQAQYRLVTAKRILNFAVCILCLTALGGCSVLDGTANLTYGYAVHIGNADQITSWGLQQVDDDKIADAIGALAYYSMVHSGDREQVASAETGIVRIYQKLIDGWPGYTGQSRYLDDHPQTFISSAERQERLDHQLFVTYWHLLEIPAIPIYLALRPDRGKFPLRYRDWWDQGKDIKLTEMKDYPAPDNP